METKDNKPEPVTARETPEESTGAEVPTAEQLDEMTGGLNLVNRASCTGNGIGMNTVVSVGGV